MIRSIIYLLKVNVYSCQFLGQLKALYISLPVRTVYSVSKQYIQIPNRLLLEVHRPVVIRR